MASSYIAHIQCSVRFTHITPGHWTCSFMYHFNSFLEHTALAAISALGTSRTYCHLCPTRYSFTPESSEASEGKVSCTRTQHRNNVPILRGEKHDISMTFRSICTNTQPIDSFRHVMQPLTNLRPSLRSYLDAIMVLILVLLNCFNCIFRHLKLELLTQFPASNDEKYYYLWKIDMFKIKLLDQQSIY